MRVVTYARVSSVEQVEHGTSLADQRARLHRQVEADGHELVGHFEDGGASGASMDRPGMKALRERVGAGGVDAMFATKIDRVGRSLLGFLDLTEELAGHGCSVRILDEGIDTSTAAGAMHGQLLSVIGAFERSRIAERTVGGRVAAARSGSFVGSTPPYGYRVVGERRSRRLVPDDEQSRAARHIVTELVLGRRPAVEVAQELNDMGLRPSRSDAWTPQGVRRWARDPAVVRNLSGTFVYRGIEIPIPALVTPVEEQAWRAWQDDPHGTRVHQTRSSGRYLLSGMVVEPCGKRAHGRTTTVVTYSCRDRLSQVPGHDDCHNLHAGDLEATVMEHVRRVLADPAVLRRAVGGKADEASPTARLVEVQERLAALDGQIAEEVAVLRQAGLRKESLVAALAPLRRQQDDLEVAARGLRRQITQQAGWGVDRAVDRAVEALRQALRTDDRTAWRTSLTALGVRVGVEGHVPCPECDGRVHLGWSTRCQACINGHAPVLDIEMDDVMALAVADQLVATARA